MVASRTEPCERKEKLRYNIQRYREVRKKNPPKKEKVGREGGMSQRQS